MAVDSFAWGLGSAILFGLLRKTYHFTNLQLGVMWSVFLITMVCLQIPMGILVQRYGCKTFFVLSEIAGAILMVGWLTVKSFEAFAVLETLMGFVVSAWIPATKTFVAGSVAEESRAEAMGKVAAFRGLIGFPAPLIGGLLYDLAGFSAPILSGLLGTVVALLMFVFLVQEPDRELEG